MDKMYLIKTKSEDGQIIISQITARSKDQAYKIACNKLSYRKKIYKTSIKLSSMELIDEFSKKYKIELEFKF